MSTSIFAHRGWHERFRENTLDAFRAAVGLGVQGVELDVRRTLDGALVIHHDPTIAGHALAQTPAHELPTYVPTLAEALGVLGGVIVNVEIKNSRDSGEVAYDETGGLAREVRAEIDRSSRGAIIVSSFDLATCEALREADDALRVAWLVDYSPRPRALSRALAQALERGFDAVNPHYRMVTPGACERAGELGLGLYVWTVNDRAALARMLRLGVDGVITDVPDLALALEKSAPS